MLSLERITFYPSLRNCILCYLLLRTKNGIPDVGGNERSGQAKGVPTKTCYQARLFAQADPESFKPANRTGYVSLHAHCGENSKDATDLSPGEKLLPFVRRRVATLNRVAYYYAHHRDESKKGQHFLCKSQINPSWKPHN